MKRLSAALGASLLIAGLPLSTFATNVSDDIQEFQGYFKKQFPDDRAGRLSGRRQRAADLR